MGIQTLTIHTLSTGGSAFIAEGLHHVKALPGLSVVQSLRGRYEVALDGGPSFFTSEGGCFIAPSRVTQDIVHHLPAEGTMAARWVFLDVEVNGLCRLDDIYEFPVILPAGREREVSALMDELTAAQEAGNGDAQAVCGRMAAGYRLLGVLLAVGREKAAPDGTLARVLSYMKEQAERPLSMEELAAQAGLSVSHFHRWFRSRTGETPLNWLNGYRLSLASLWLKNSDCPVSEAAQRAGFDNPFYFSRLFRRKYGVPPREYRRLSRNEAGGEEESS